MTSESIKSGTVLHAVDWGACLLLLAALLGTVLFLGVAAVEDVAWPCLYDALRDVGVAQAILDGRYPEDHIFLGESEWFNPLTGAVVAAGAGLLDVPPPRASVQIGPYVNLLVPLLFFLLVAALFGRWAGLGALVFLLFGNAQSEFVYATATYTPWLFAPHLALAGLFLTFLLYHAALKRIHWALYAAAGGALALTFMTHTGSAVLFGGSALLTTAWMLWAERGKAREERSYRPVIVGFCVLVAVAFLASLPYTYSILWNYQFRIVSPFPNMNTEAAARIERLPEILRGLVSFSGAVTLTGFIWLAWFDRERLRKRLVLCWLAVAVLFLLSTYLWQWFSLALYNVPQIVPGHHFLIAVAAVKAVLFGCGLYALSQLPFALRQLATKQGDAVAAPRKIPGSAEWMTMAACVVIAVVALIPGYTSWEQFSAKPEHRLPLGNSMEGHLRLYTWIRQQCPPDAVFLCGDQPGLLAVGPAGRKVVSTMLIFANPYVDTVRRFADREAMFDAIRTKDGQGFRRISSQYGVRYLLCGEWENRLVEAWPDSGFDRVFCSGPLTVYHVPGNGLPETPDR